MMTLFETIVMNNEDAKRVIANRDRAHEIMVKRKTDPSILIKEPMSDERMMEWIY